MVYISDTFHGSSGSPVFFVNEGEAVLLAVHRKNTKALIKYAGAVTNSGYDTGSILTQDFLGHLILPNST